VTEQEEDGEGGTAMEFSSWLGVLAVFALVGANG
jgi:hypothetical protein